ncbi:MAG: molybdate ABC transporter substrate-binding protein [Halobacteriovorax sp.]|nr:molybdate ABC transporter substrate-binding protein [Halobacteriovorax sp.]|tara:strand:- start:27649 stop:28368 length:720 start_codon:yes stop_codon:yes gene_type:complete
MRLFICLIFGLSFTPVFGSEVRLAVASNFANPIKELIREFEKNSDIKIKLSLGSTGKQYAQILQGAPFDLFLSADSLRPKLLEEKGIGVRSTRSTYAVGKLVLWTPKIRTSSELLKDLKNINFKYISIAKPKLAPYGKLAKNYLRELGIWKKLNNKMVQGQNINQAMQFVLSGNAQLGLLAYSQVKNLKGSLIKLDDRYKIAQQVILLKESTSNRKFLSFLKSNQAKKIIQDLGYEVRP